MAYQIIRLLFFRTTRNEFLKFDRKFFIAGLIGTWIVGMGRYWDDPGAHLLQHLGLGSVIYIFTLSALIWLIIKPYFVDHWTYFRVLTFVSLTSFPAVFYAIPVERFFTVETAANINAWFLAIVAAWRLSLFFYFLRMFTRLNVLYILVGTLLPVCMIIVTLTALNLERAVFNIMGGIRNQTSNDTAYAILFSLTVLSALAAIPLLAGYIIATCIRWRTVRKEKKEGWVKYEEVNE